MPRWCWWLDPSVNTRPALPTGCGFSVSSKNVVLYALASERTLKEWSPSISSLPLMKASVKVLGNAELEEMSAVKIAAKENAQVDDVAEMDVFGGVSVTILIPQKDVIAGLQGEITYKTANGDFSTYWWRGLDGLPAASASSSLQGILTSATLV